MRMTDSGSEPGPTEPSGTTAGHVSSEVAVPAVPFGEWPSPITAAAVATGQVKVSSPTVLGSDVWWQQGLPDEGGRTTVMHSSGGTQTALLAAPWNARTRVHEYGGRSYLPIPRAVLPARGKDGAADDAARLSDPVRQLRRPAALPDRTGASGADPLTPDPAAVPAGDGAEPLPARRPPVRRLCPVARPPRGLVRAGAAFRRESHSRDRGSAAGRHCGR